jgi:hypothetical protein
VESALRTLSEVPVPSRFAVVGAVVLGIAGGVAGLVSGLLHYPPTAWFAVVELGMPAAVVGGLAGYVLGLLLQAVRVARKHLVR